MSNVVVWSMVEAGVAVIAACLPTVRPLFLGKSPESLIGSIRSMLSLNSIGRSHDRERRGSDSEALASGGGVNLDQVRTSESKGSQPLVETQISGNCPKEVEVPANEILMQNGISFKEEVVGDVEAKTMSTGRVAPFYSDASRV